MGSSDGNMDRNFAWRIFFVALVFRLIPVLFSYDLGIGLDDMFQYDMLARSMVAGDGYRWYAEDDLHFAQQFVQFDLADVELDPRGILTSFKPPLYSAFLALIYFLTGVGAKRFFVVRLIQTITGAFLAPLVYALARYFLPEKEKAARGAAWVVTLYPMLIIYPLSLATENLFFPLVLGTILSLLKASEKRKLGYFVLTGFLFGLSALTRSIILPVGGLCVLWVWLALRERKSALLMFLTMLVVITPWMARNSFLNQRLSGIETSMGYNLYVGYHPQGTGTFQYGISLDLLTILDDGTRDQVGMEAVKGFILDNPKRIPYLALRKLGYFFGLERRALTYFYSNNFFGFVPLPSLIFITLILLLPFVIVSVSAVFGLAFIRWNKRTALLLLIMFGYISPHLLIQAEERFHLLMVPFFGILAAHSWNFSFLDIKAQFSSPAKRWGISLAALVVLLLFLNWGLELWRDADKLMLLFGPDGNQARFPY